MNHAGETILRLRVEKWKLKKAGRRRTLLAFAVGLLLGAGAMIPVYLEARRNVTLWADLQAGTRDSWLQDRQDWRDGKPFEVRYGRHHRSW